MKTTNAKTGSYTIRRSDCPEKNRLAARGSEPASGCSQVLLKNAGKKVPVLHKNIKLRARVFVTSESSAPASRVNYNTLHEKRDWNRTGLVMV